MWKHLNHPNIVPFVGVTFEPLQLVSEWMAGGELREYIKNNPNADLNGLVSQSRILFARVEVYPILQILGVAEGLAYLHTLNVIHGDLKGVGCITHPTGLVTDRRGCSRTYWLTGLVVRGSRILV